MLKTLTLSYNKNCRKNEKNSFYPNRVVVDDPKKLESIFSFDWVCGTMRNNHRANEDFISADCFSMDTDNDHSADENDWLTESDHGEILKGVEFYASPSKSNMKPKGKCPWSAPRFHQLFPTRKTFTDAVEYKAFKVKVAAYVLYCRGIDPVKVKNAIDIGALDAARYFNGIENPVVTVHEGTILIDDFMDSVKDTEIGIMAERFSNEAIESDLYKDAQKLPEVFEVGSRHHNMICLACRLLRRYYDDREKAHELFEEANEQRCSEPLSDYDLGRIWENACKYHSAWVKPDGWQSSNDYEASKQRSTAEDDFNDEPKRGRPAKKTVTVDVLKDILSECGYDIRLNEITGYNEVSGIPSVYSRTNAVNTLPTLIRDIIKKKGMKSSKQDLIDGLAAIADERRFNPIREMLDSAEWDKTDRVTEIYQILGISVNKDSMLYVRKWLHQTIALALNNDSDPYGADGALVLQSETQGIGKSRFFQVISMKSDWFAGGGTIDLTSKDSQIQAVTKWITEIGELDSTFKKEQLNLKAFITQSVDEYRRPYATASVRNPRRCSFCATVNPTDFLRDETGSRRWWTVHVDKIDVERLNQLDYDWLQQMWRQVYETLYKVNPQGFRLTDDERRELGKSNEQFTQLLPGEQEILETLDWDSDPLDWCSKVTASSIKEQIPSLYRFDSKQVGRAMKQLSKKYPAMNPRKIKGSTCYTVPMKRSILTDFSHNA